MANYDNANGFRPSRAELRRDRVTVGGTAVNEGDVLGMAAGVVLLYSASTHPQGPYGVAAEDGAAAAVIDCYVIEPGARFLTQFDGTYAPTSHDGERFDLTGATGAQMIATTQTTGLVRVIRHAPEVGSLDTGANARVECEFMFGAGAGINLPSFRSSSVPAAAADRVTNTIAATAFATTKNLDVSELRVGDRLAIRAAVKVVSSNSTDTLATALKLGSVTLASSTATNVANNDVVTYEGEVEVTALGAGGAIQGFISQVSLLAGTPAAGPNLVGPAQAIDLSADINLTVVGTWSVAHADNDADLVELTLRRIPAWL